MFASTASGSDDEDVRISSLIRDPVRIVHPLSQDLLKLLPDAAQLETPIGSLLSTSLVSALNNVICRGAFQHRYPIVLRISPDIVVKIYSDKSGHHVKALQHVHAHAPLIPAPRTHGLLRTESEHDYYHFMEYIPGDTLEYVWPHLSIEQKRSVRDQLTSIFRQLRSVPPPSTNANESGWGWKGICKESRRSRYRTTLERNIRVSERVIKDEAAFNDFVATGESEKCTSWTRMLRSFMSEDHALVMTHSDLHPRHIIVKLVDCAGNEVGADSDCSGTENIKIVSIVGWERCGWYPEYWEFIKGIESVHHRHPIRDWWEYLPECIGVWPVEATLHRLIS